MWKSVLAGTTALVIAGSALAVAQQGPTSGRVDVQRWRPSAQDITAFGDARIAALKEGLKLTADQEKLWPPLEKALRDASKARADRMAARASADRPSDPVERMQFRAQRLSEAGASLKSIADAAAPLYKVLDDGQKHRFTLLARVEANNMREHWRMRHGRHRGFDGMDDQDRRGPPRQ